MTAFDEVLLESRDARRPTRSYTPWLPFGLGRSRVDQVLSYVRILTYVQSEDPMWFLLRAFRFTSRAGHSLLAAVARNFVCYMKGFQNYCVGLY